MAASGSVCRRLFLSSSLWQWCMRGSQNAYPLLGKEEACSKPLCRRSGMSWMRFTALRRINNVADPSVKSDGGSAGATETSSEKILHLSDSCVEVSFSCSFSQDDSNLVYQLRKGSFTSGEQESRSVFSTAVCKIQAIKRYIESLPLVLKVERRSYPCLPEVGHLIGIWKPSIWSYSLATASSHLYGLIL